MKWLVLVVLVFGCGGKGKEQELCEHGSQVCGDLGPVPQCVDQVKAMKDSLGDKYETMVSCGTAAQSCAELMGCFAGGIDEALKLFGKDLEQGMGKLTDRSDGDPKREKWRRHPETAAATTCEVFTGVALDAKWDRCSDHIRRELRCAPVGDSVQCKCLEDGAEKWQFAAKDPQLADRVEATRIAKSNCHQSFEGF